MYTDEKYIKHFIPKTGLLAKLILHTANEWIHKSQDPRLRIYS